MGEQSRAASIASQAVSLSVDCGDDTVAFRVRLGAAVVLAESGHVNEALTALDDETGPMSDTDRGRLAIHAPTCFTMRDASLKRSTRSPPRKRCSDPIAQSTTASG